jgi:hypothetical protein
MKNAFTSPCTIQKTIFKFLTPLISLLKIKRKDRITMGNLYI